MTQRTILFHVGYHKTGTTWMQRRLFVPDCGYRQLCGHEDVWDHITRPHTLAFDPAAARAALIDSGAPEDGLVPVISSEILSGHPFYGGRESADFADRLHRIAPEARVLLTIRAQVPAIASVYMQYVRRGGCLSPARFFAGSDVLGFDGFDPVHFEYHRLVARYREIFGAEQVKVMTQDSLARAPDAFFAELAAFTGRADGTARPNTDREAVSDPESAVPVLRRLNYLFYDGANPAPVLDLSGASRLTYRAVSWLMRRPAAKTLFGSRPVTQEAKRRFAGRFAASNRALRAMYPDLDLTGFEL